MTSKIAFVIITLILLIAIFAIDSEPPVEKKRQYLKIQFK